MRRPLRCVVTGGSLGIGAGITRGLLARGAEVIVGCRDVARAEGRHGGRPYVYFERVDVSDVDEVRAFADRVSARWDAVDLLVNNAGASFRTYRTSSAGHELSFATNVLGGFAVTRALRPLLRRADGHGRVVSVGSAGQYLRPLRVDRLLQRRGPYVHAWVYVHTKRAQFELSERWAEELDGEGISVTCVHPGVVATPGVEEAFPTWHRLFGHRLEGADEAADTAVWLGADPEAAGLTGGLWWRRERQPTDLVPWTRARRGERERLWRACLALTSSLD